MTWEKIKLESFVPWIHTLYILPFASESNIISKIKLLKVQTTWHQRHTQTYSKNIDDRVYSNLLNCQACQRVISPGVKQHKKEHGYVLNIAFRHITIFLTPFKNLLLSLKEFFAFGREAVFKFILILPVKQLALN